MAKNTDHTIRRTSDWEFEDDRALIVAIANGDEHALRALYEREARWLAARLLRTMPTHAVEDVLQETFLAVWRGANRYQGSGDAGGWVWGIARRQAALWQRRYGCPIIDIDGVAERTLASPGDPAAEAMARVDVQCAFAAAGSTGSPGADLAHRYFVEDQSLAEIAHDLDIPTGTVKSRIFALRRAMKQALGKEVDW